MTTTYIYIVEDATFTDSIPFGEAWKQAKEEAKKRHCAIYRRTIKECYDVYMKGGILLDVNHAKPEDIEKFGG